jgi:hypothetical protein
MQGLSTGADMATLLGARLVKTKVSKICPVYWSTATGNACYGVWKGFNTVTSLQVNPCWKSSLRSRRHTRPALITMKFQHGILGFHGDLTRVLKILLPTPGVVDSWVHNLVRNSR